MHVAMAFAGSNPARRIMASQSGCHAPPPFPFPVSTSFPKAARHTREQKKENLAALASPAEHDK